MKDFRLLAPEDIEVKVKKVTDKGALLLLYKTARTDMGILDETVGPMNWSCEYHTVKDVLYCTISIFNPETGEWVSKQDCGIESRTDGEGNEVKGESSDAFKRAGFRWGIGRELYSAPFIWANIPTKKEGSAYKLADPFARFSVQSIDYDDSRKIRDLTIVNNKGEVVFTTGRRLAAKAKNSKPEPVMAERNTPPAKIGKKGAGLFMRDTIARYGMDKAQRCLIDLKNVLGLEKLEDMEVGQQVQASEFIMTWEEN